MITITKLIGLVRHPYRAKNRNRNKKITGIFVTNFKRATKSNENICERTGEPFMCSFLMPKT
jgi:hypothetical protein